MRLIEAGGGSGKIGLQIPEHIGIDAARRAGKAVRDLTRIVARHAIDMSGAMEPAPIMGPSRSVLPADILRGNRRRQIRFSMLCGIAAGRQRDTARIGPQGKPQGSYYGQYGR